MPTAHTNRVTRFRFPTTTPVCPPETSIINAGAPPALTQGGWDSFKNPTLRCTLQDAKATGDQGSPASVVSGGGTGNPHTTLMAYAITNDTLAGQTISGTIELLITAKESTSATDGFLKVYAWVRVGGTDGTVRGVLCDFTSSSELPLTATGISTGALPITPLEVEEGDRLVIEIGWQRNIAFSFPPAKECTLYLSGGVTDAGVEQDDVSIGSTDTNFGTVLEFADGIDLIQYVPVSGDVLTGNANLGLVDPSTGLPVRSLCTRGSPVAASGITVRASDGHILVCADTGFNYAPSFLWEYSENFEFVQFLPIGTGINPHSLALMPDESVLVGFVGDDGTGCGEDGDTGTPSAPSYAVHLVSAAGAVLDTFALAPDLGASQAIRLRPDGRTLVYTSLGRKVKQYDVVADTQLSDFADLGTATAGEVARGIALLPDGGLLVADGLDVKRLDASGAVTQTYTFPASQPPVFVSEMPYSEFYTDYFVTDFGSYADFGVIALDVDGSGFWVATRSDHPDAMLGTLAHFALDSGVCTVIVTQPYIEATGGGFCSGGLGLYALNPPVIGPIAWLEWPREAAL